MPRGQPWCLLKCYHKLLTEDTKLAKWKNEQVKHCLELVEHTIYGPKALQPNISFTIDQSVRLAFMIFTRL